MSSVYTKGSIIYIALIWGNQLLPKSNDTYQCGDRLQQQPIPLSQKMVAIYVNKYDKMIF